MFSRASRGALFAVRTRRGEMRREILRGDRDRGEKEEGKGVKRQPERNDGEREDEGKRGERERNTELSGIDLVVGVRPGAEQGHRCFSASTGLASEPPAPEPPLRISLDSTGHWILSGNPN